MIPSTAIQLEFVLLLLSYRFLPVVAQCPLGVVQQNGREPPYCEGSLYPNKFQCVPCPATRQSLAVPNRRCPTKRCPTHCSPTPCKSTPTGSPDRCMLRTGGFPSQGP